MQLRAPRRQLHKRVALHKICPSRWNLAQMPIAIVKVHEALSENTAVLNQIKLLAVQRMEGMRDPYLTAFLVRDGAIEGALKKMAALGVLLELAGDQRIKCNSSYLI